MRPPDILYHYTTASALEGIVSQGRIRATNIRYLNDSSELAQGRDTLQRAFDEFRSRQRNAGKKVLRGINLARLCEQYDFYVFSLSEHADQLSQWRGYCSNEPGYAIGFERKALAQLVSEKGLPVVPVRLDYSGGTDHPIAYVRGLLRGFKELEAENIRLSQRLARNYIQEALLAEVLSFKNQAFWEEREWRLVVLLEHEDSTSVNVVTRRSHLVPFIHIGASLPEGKLPIKEIVLGPGMDEVRGRGAVKALLNAHGYQGVEIRASGIPYRT